MSRINAYGLSSKEYASLYDVWKNMLERCYNSQSDRFYTYGERGIAVCKEWREDFHAFARWALENGWNQSIWIERRDVNGMYSPDNCTFIGRKEQMRNKTNNIRIIIDGDERCLTEWCEIFGVDFKTVWSRYKVLGITDKESLFYPGDLREIRNPAILQFTLDGEQVGRYARLKDAVEKSGANRNSIRNACRGKLKTAGGYRWSYAGGE